MIEYEYNRGQFVSVTKCMCVLDCSWSICNISIRRSMRVKNQRPAAAATTLGHQHRDMREREKVRKRERLIRGKHLKVRGAIQL